MKDLYLKVLLVVWVLWCAVFNYLILRSQKTNNLSGLEVYNNEVVVPKMEGGCNGKG